MELFNRAGHPHQPNTKTAGGKPARTFRPKCSRCGGAGGRQAWAYTGTTCYDCGGSGLAAIRTENLYTQAELDVLNARLAKRQARELDKRNAEAARINAERNALRAQFLVDQAPALRMLDQLVEGSNSAEFFKEIRDTVVMRAYISEKQATMIVARHAEMILQREAAKRNHHFGEVGKRAKGVRVVVNKSIHIGTNRQFYPPAERWLVLMTTEAGCALAWFTNRSEPEGEGVAAFTVKEHADYKGAPQTIVQRVKFEESKEAAVA